MGFGGAFETGHRMIVDPVGHRAGNVVHSAAFIDVMIEGEGVGVAGLGLHVGGLSNREKGQGGQ